jgi:Ni/Co efflux regulator RcnB
MKIVLFSGVAAAGLLFAATGASATDSTVIASQTDMSKSMQLVAHGRKAGGQIKPGGHRIGFHPRPGFHGIPKHDVYRRPHRGFILPRYWVQPTFYLYNFRNYGLSQPTSGYYWSRYYDDAVLTDSRGYVQDYRSDIDWNNSPDRTDDYREPDYGPSIRPDGKAYDWNDGVAFAAPDGSSYSYDGEWEGEYVDPQGRVFEGEWEGRVTRQDGVAGPGYPVPKPHHAQPPGAPYPGPHHSSSSDDYYDVPRGYDNYERCLKSNGLTGAAIGALLGGIAGNRIAGRGNRTGGTLAGAGIGGLLGVAVEKANDKCKHHRPRDPRPPVGYPSPNYGHGWQGGYYYYPQAPQVTVTVVPGATHTTTTVTEEIYYETVKSHPRKKAVRKWKPKPKPRCVCR